MPHCTSQQLAQVRTAVSRCGYKSELKHQLKDASACCCRFLYVFVLGGIGLPCLIAVMSEVCSR